MFFYVDFLLFSTAYAANHSSDLKSLSPKGTHCGSIITSKYHQWLLQSDSAVCYWAGLKSLWENSQKFQQSGMYEKARVKSEQSIETSKKKTSNSEQNISFNTHFAYP